MYLEYRKNRLWINRKESIQTLVNLITDHFLLLDDSWVKSKSRKQDFVDARKIFIYILRNEFGLSYPKLAEIIGREDHTTPLYLYNEVENSDKYKEIANKITILLK